MIATHDFLLGLGLTGYDTPEYRTVTLERIVEGIWSLSAVSLMHASMHLLLSRQHP